MGLEKDLHRTIYPRESKNYKKALSKARILETRKDRAKTFDVHYHRPEFTVKPPGKDNITHGGLSVWSSSHCQSEYTEDPPNWENLNSALTKYTKKGIEKQMPRFFCYKLAAGEEFPSMYSIKQKERNPEGYYLYPQQDITLDGIICKDGIPQTGLFPEIENLNWKRCSVIYKPADKETYEWMKANGPEPDFKKHNDSDCEVVIQAIEGEISCFEFEELDEVYNTINLIHELQSFNDLKNLTTEKRKIISCSLQESMLNGHADDSEYFYPVWQKFSKLENEIENQSDLVIQL